MPSIFNSEDCQLYINRINAITASTQPLWGKMNSTQLMGHCAVSFYMITGKMQMKRGLIGLLFGKLAKKIIVSDKPFRRNSPTAKEFIIPGGKNFEEEKAKLIAAIADLNQKGPTAVKACPHPFFGTLTLDEWDALMCKHLNHHLEQFGV